MGKSLIGNGGGVTAAQWGTGSAGSGATTLMIVTSITLSVDGKVAPLPNEDDETIGELDYDQFTDITVEGIAKNSASLPARQSEMTIDGVVGRVKKAEKLYANNAWKKLRITLKRIEAMESAPEPEPED